MSSSSSTTSFERALSASRLEQLLSTIPSSWLGTTFPNDSRYVGRSNFIDAMYTLLSSESSQELKEEQLEKLFPEDYVRLGSPLSTILELARALRFRNQFTSSSSSASSSSSSSPSSLSLASPYATFSFASKTLPLLVILLASSHSRKSPHLIKRKVIVHGDISFLSMSPFTAPSSSSSTTSTPVSPFSPSRLFDCVYVMKGANIPPPTDIDANTNNTSIIVQCVKSAYTINGITDESIPSSVDAVISDDGFLFVRNTDKIPIEDVKDGSGEIVVPGVHTLRKRLAAPIPTPDVVALLHSELAILQRKSVEQVKAAANAVAPTQPIDLRSLNLHLLQLAGVKPYESDSDVANATLENEVVIATTGLAALAPVMCAAYSLGEGSCDVIQCSTAYGGSCQQADILTDTASSHNFQKYTYDIQGGEPVLDAIRLTLNKVKQQTQKRKPFTLLQLEYPTNPDMKDCDLAGLHDLILEYESSTQSQVIVIVDTTFSPQSQVARHLSSTKKPLPLLIFNSLSKSISGGFTTGGSVVANEHPLARRVLSLTQQFLTLFDTAAKPSQLQILSKWHSSTETRVAQAFANAVSAATRLEESVIRIADEQMQPVHFVNAVQIARGVTPGTFSFNLPAPFHLNGDAAKLDKVAQQFVDDLVAANPKLVKPCVSFGQENTLVYATVPATSTQGVISAAAKAKQAVGGVQLVRFSFPPSLDKPAWEAALDLALRKSYPFGESRRRTRMKLYAASLFGLLLAVIAGGTYYYRKYGVPRPLQQPLQRLGVPNSWLVAVAASAASAANRR